MMPGLHVFNLDILVLFKTLHGRDLPDGTGKMWLDEVACTAYGKTWTGLVKHGLDSLVKHGLDSISKTWTRY